LDIFIDISLKAAPRDLVHSNSYHSPFLDKWNLPTRSSN